MKYTGLAISFILYAYYYTNGKVDKDIFVIAVVAFVLSCVGFIKQD
nr:MAG TPA: Mature oligodendrocyte transmembrane protein [Caudoviricetes sp.]